MSSHVPSHKELLRSLRKQGWTLKQGRKHINAISPDGQHRLVLSVSPSDRRSIYHIQAQLRRIGARI